MRKFFISLCLVFAICISPLAALAEPAVVTVRVDGLSCPFCAYGLEKKALKMDGVEGIKIDLEGGKVEIRFKDREDVQIEKIEQAVKDAGFTPRSIKVQESRQK